MQSWGTRSRFTERDTELEPSKSGVAGVLCAALGRPRDEDVSDLAALRMGVRVDREGTLSRDYQTAGGVDGIVRASGSVAKFGVLSNRYYLADADFLVGLESADGDLLARLDEALAAPRWQLSLGRKSFVPGVPPNLPGGGVREAGLSDALEGEPWPLRPSRGRPARPGRETELRLVIETDFSSAGAETRMDQPLGAAFRERTFGPRAVVQRYIRKEPVDVSQPSDA